MNGVDRRELLAVLLVFLLAAGLGQFPQKATLAGYSDAIKVRDASKGQLHISIAAAVASAYSAAAGVPFSPDAIEQVLLALPPVLLGISAVFIFLSARKFGFEAAPSALGALLFAFSLPVFGMLPGVFGPQSFGLPSFSLFLLFFAHAVSCKSKAMLMASAALGGLTGFLSPEFGAAAALAALSFFLPAALEGRKADAAVLLLVALVGAGASAASPLFITLVFKPGAIASLLELSPFLLAAASASTVSLIGKGRHWGMLAIAGAALSGLSPLAASALLSVPAAAGASVLLSSKEEKGKRLMACALLCFFAVAGLAMPLLGTSKAAVAALLICPLLPLMLHLYDYRGAVPVFAIAALLLCSAFFFPLSSLPPSRPDYPQYSSPEVKAALQSIQGAGGEIYLPGSFDAARFYLPGFSLGDSSQYAAYLHSANATLPRGSYLLISLASLDDPYSISGRGSFEAFYFASAVSSQSRPFAVFYSQSGIRLVREISPDGSLSLRDGQLVDGTGTIYASVPLSRMVMARDDAPFDSPGNRLLVISEGEPLPHFVSILSSRDPKLGKVYEKGDVILYKVV